jgi:hypothetical protein
MVSSGPPGRCVNIYFNMICKKCGQKHTNKGGIGMCKDCLTKEYLQQRSSIKTKKYMEGEILDIGEVPDEEIAENEEEEIV